MAVSARKRHPVRALVRFHTGAFRADVLYVADRRERNAELPLERAVIERARRSHDELVLLAALRRLLRGRAGHQRKAIEFENDSRAALGREMRGVGRDTVGAVDRRRRAVRREPAPLAKPRNGMRKSVAMPIGIPEESRNWK